MSDDNSIVVKLTALGDDFQSGINSALGTWTSFMGKLGDSPATFASVAAAGVAVLGSLFAMAKGAANLGEELGKLSAQTGISVEDLALLKYAAEQSETNLNSLAQAVKFMQKNLVDAASGNQAAALAFEALGLSIEDMQKMSTSDQLMAMADAISSVQDPALRTKLALATMGRGALDMLPMLAEGGAGIQKLKDQAAALGLGFTGENSKAAKAFGDSLKTLWAVIAQVGIDIGLVLMPPIKWLTDALIRLGQVITAGLADAFHTLLGIIWKVAENFSYAWLQIAKLTDLLHLTSDASKTAGEWMKTFGDLSKESSNNAQNSFNKFMGLMEATDKAQKENNKTVKSNKDLTDAQRLAILNRQKTTEDATAADKTWLTESKALYKSYLDDINNVLDYKKAVGTYDEEYYAAYKIKLLIAGQDEKTASEMVLAEKQKNGEIYLQDELSRKKKIHDYDEAYFIEFAQVLADSGANEQQVAQGVADEKSRILKQELRENTDQNALLKQMYSGLGEAIKQIWSDSGTTFKDVWKTALDNLVNILVVMVLEAQGAAKAIEVSMAEATFGLSIVIGLIGIIFGSSSTSSDNSKIQQALDTFLDSIKTSLRSFETQVTDTLKRTTLLSGNVATDWATFMSTIGSVDTETATNQLSDIEASVTARYDLEKSLINDVMDLLKSQKSYVKDINSAISDVTRSTYTPEELFSAQKSDITTLYAEMMAATGQDQIDLATELKQAYLDYWNTAQSLYSGGDLTAIQDAVIAGLEDVKDVGTSAYDQLIDINLEALGVSRDGNDLMQQMVDLQTSMENDMLAFYDAMAAWSTGANGYQTLYEIFKAIQALFPTLDLGSYTTLSNGSLVGMASGAYVSKATQALVGEGGEAEWVLPESKLASFLQLSAKANASAGGMVGAVNLENVNFSFPNIKSFDDFSVPQVEQLLKTTFRRAAENLGRNGYDWGMPPSR